MILPTQMGFIVPAPAGGGGWSGPTTNLTHRWPMDDANVSGTTITDVVAGLNGTAGAGVSSGTGPFTQARAIANAANGYISLAATPLADFTAAWSIQAWVMQPDITAASYDGGNPRLFAFFDATVDMPCTSGLDGSLSVDGTGGSSGSGASDASILTNNVWTHWCFTHAASSASILIYVNAVSKTVNAGIGGTGGGANTIGARNVSSGSSVRPWPGSIYQVATWSKALSSAEVLQAYNAS